MVSCRPNITPYVTKSDATWSICVLGTPVSCAKTDEPTEMQFAVENWRRALKDCTRWKCTQVHTGATWRIQWNDLCGSGDAVCRYRDCIATCLFLASLGLEVRASRKSVSIEICERPLGTPLDVSTGVAQPNMKMTTVIGCWINTAYMMSTSRKH